MISQQVAGDDLGLTYPKCEGPLAHRIVDSKYALFQQLPLGAVGLFACAPAGSRPLCTPKAR